MFPSRPRSRPLPYAAIVQAPARLRALVRGSEIGLVALAAVAGCVAGAAVAAMAGSTQFLREVLYRLPDGRRLSAMPELGAWYLLAGPAIGGAVLGLAGLLLRRRGGRRRALVDPIEANALHGGRMSLTDSLVVAVQNVISNGCGASVGLEAGYTQIASGLASRLGSAFELRRSDLRTMVGCGSAAAIAAAFGSPLTGAFYAFELIIGTYTIATLAPVIVAALCGSLVARALASQGGAIDASGLSGIDATRFTTASILPALAIGLICAALAVALMRGVTLVERGFNRSRLPNAVRPAIGGACVGLLALAASPQVLSGGHGALQLHLGHEASVAGALGLAALLAAKAAASAVSIGAGFRGGLFFASLFLGVLVGKIFAVLVPEILPYVAAFDLPPVTCAIVGMGALAAAIVGGPLTMTFLALETTGNFSVAALVLVAVLAASLAVRKTFGYSFATWRFHLRGESIRSAHDVGWIRSLTVGGLMRRDVSTVPLDTPLPTFLRAHPLGSPSRVVLVDALGRYAGLVLVPEVHALAADAGRDAAADEPRLADAARYAEAFLLPDMNAKQAAATFDAAESEALVVLDAPGTRRVLGLLTESHTLKRYSDELDRQRRAISGETV